MPQLKLESISRTREPKYYPQVFLEECRYKFKNIRRARRINYGFEKSSSEESENEPKSDADDGVFINDYESDKIESEKPSNKSDNDEHEKPSNASENNESKKSSKNLKSFLKNLIN